jgi:hypothetical protein
MRVETDGIGTRRNTQGTAAAGFGFAGAGRCAQPEGGSASHGTPGGCQEGTPRQFGFFTEDISGHHWFPYVDVISRP